MRRLDPNWEQRRTKGLMRYLIVDGILFMGGPFALALQVLGYFLFPDGATSFGAYLASSTTWVRFLLHGTLFGLIAGAIKWRRNEIAYARTKSGVK